MDAVRRQEESGTDKFLDLIADPFQAEVSVMLHPHIPVPNLHHIGPRELHLCCYCVLVRNFWPTGHRILLPPTAKLTSICATSETCGRETPTETARQEAIRLAECRHGCQRAGSGGHNRLGCSSVSKVPANDSGYLLRVDGHRLWHSDTDKRCRRVELLQAVE
jgi:hypothetical protein